MIEDNHGKPQDEHDTGELPKNSRKEKEDTRGHATWRIPGSKMSIQNHEENDIGVSSHS